ncbi:dihydrofolate reductase [Mesorhizobium sp. YIM 152430]|uniref:dihydrofolate reductase n=1 Tax=Mesorhizobium sp. YIM 152430 TaxID=3031761 RepID=UPI0023DB6AE6|nr:dihydrofolate reductase [Mesorhizobium sp. YIM 152430]MDF1598328.1 dihydrofolate reductase [Mesorhizobium sp. YIM 152430]
MTKPVGPPITMVVAIAENGVIGRDGDLPWRLSTDLRRFKALTLGKPIVMGRRTWESFPKRPLPGRTNIVITRQADFADEGAVVAHSLEEAIAIAKGEKPDEICVIGGGQIFRDSMPLASVLHITHILASIDGDTFFPPIERDVWRKGRSERVPAGERDSHATEYAIYSRKSATNGR